MHKRNSFVYDSRGSVGVIFGMVALVVFAAAGAAVDYGRASSTRTALQAATDASATAAASSASDGDPISLATDVFRANYTGSPAPGVSVAGTGQKVTVTATVTLRTSRMAAAGIEEVEVATSSEAVAYDVPLCVLLLETTQFGLYADSDARLDANKCGVYVNSKHKSQALYANSSHITAADVLVVGGSEVSGGGTVTPAPTEGVSEKADPMADLPEPVEVSAPCDYTDFTVNNAQTKTMSPGVYCKKTLINSGGTAIMLPGVYVFRGGEFLVNSRSTVSGSEVMLFFADKDARLNVNSGSTFQVSAPKSGTYEGVLLFQSRHPSTKSAPPHIVNSDSNTEVGGAIYLPNGIFEVNSLSDPSVAADYTAIIARQMVLNSKGAVQVRANFPGDTPLPPLLADFRATASARLVR
jgi:Flp pilus assembly protein TadG